MYQPACELPARGWFVRPTLFTNVAQSSRIAQEEIFGPVLSVLTFRTPDEAIEKANNTPYGLSAGVWTEKGSRILAMASGCAPASSGRTRSTASTRRARSAATRNRASAARAACTACSRTSTSATGTDVAGRRTRRWRHRRRTRAIAVRKTYKLYIGGQFPRSESGRSYVVRAPDGTPLANAVRGSRKDLRDAVRAARGAFPGWPARPP